MNIRCPFNDNGSAVDLLRDWQPEESQDWFDGLAERLFVLAQTAKNQLESIDVQLGQMSFNGDNKGAFQLLVTDELGTSPYNFNVRETRGQGRWYVTPDDKQGFLNESSEGYNLDDPESEDYLLLIHDTLVTLEADTDYRIEEAPLQNHLTKLLPN